MSGSDERTPEFRLLIVDDHSVVRQGLLALFQTAGVEDAVASGVGEAVQMTRRFAPDVVLMGMGPPSESPWQTARSILSRRPPPRLLLLDDALRPAHVCSALAAGASGYWTKHAPFEKLAKAVRSVAAGESSFCPEARRYLAPGARGLRFRPPAEATGVARLTRRESEVLALLAEGCTVKECGRRLQLSPRTVDNHKSRMMRKLGVHNIVALVRLAVREGIVGQ